MIDWLEAHMGTCVFVKYFNFECLGCGAQRAFIALLKGDLSLSLKLYPALIPYLTTLLLAFTQVIFKFKSGGFYVMWSFIISVGIMLTSYIVKLIS